MRLLSVIFFYILTSCNTTAPDPKWKTFGPYYIGEAIDYIKFKKGTYWVYKDLKTQKFDTIVFQQDFHDTIKYEDNYDGKSGHVAIKEYYTCQWYSVSTGYTYNFYMRAPFIYENMDGKRTGLFGFDLSKHKPGAVVTIYNFLVAPFDRKDHNYVDVIAQDTSITINSVTYDHVLYLGVRNDVLSNEPDTYVYWAKNYGMIKVDYSELNNPIDEYNDLELFSSNIVQ